MRAGAAAAVAALEKDLLMANAAAEKSRRAAAADLQAAHATAAPLAADAAEAPKAEAVATDAAPLEAAARSPDTQHAVLLEGKQAEIEQLRARVEGLELQLETVRWQAVTASEEQEAEVRPSVACHVPARARAPGGRCWPNQLLLFISGRGWGGQNGG